MSAPADWQLPPGVSRAVWEYAHDSATAENYDANLVGTPMLDADLKFVFEHIDEASRVIDLGCGTGRVAIPLAEAGHHVVGVDLSEPMLRVARGKLDSSNAKWINANIVDMGAFRDATFDVALCLFSTLGMIAGVEARARVAAEACRLLRPGGRFLLHVHHLGHLLTSSAGRKKWFSDRLRRWTRKTTVGDFPMPSANGLPGWTMHLFTRREIVGLLQAAGFRVERLSTIGIDGKRLSWPRSWFGYGFLIAASKPGP